ncbi:hypothetical protein [Kyrpidia tusciae]|uniref:Aminotransferase, class IV n=1 Tax=Kyrpidia tusciae (strain DSM 2912 / NBRC 15312 / T2) TaxID=562970 RepID=D5WV24_KYRT2|nr:hypothetical protein [Kyrpidia tusciae]ADG07496.1 aminotransferase, class IV [Kyrpidia tusciae DSM 2912]
MFIVHRHHLKSDTFRRVARILDRAGSDAELEEALRDVMFQISRATACRLPGQFAVRQFRIGRLRVSYDASVEAYCIQFDPGREPARASTQYHCVPLRHFWMANAVYDESGHLFALELMGNPGAETPVPLAPGTRPS